jgi:putative sterol carrier protein
MSAMIDQAVAVMQDRFGDGFDGSAKFVIEGEGAIMVDADGVRAADEPAAVTLTASVETFRAILDGDLSPTMAFMSGRLAIEGDMGQAMRLGSAMG